MESIEVDTLLLKSDFNQDLPFLLIEILKGEENEKIIDYHTHTAYGLVSNILDSNLMNLIFKFRKYIVLIKRPHSQSSPSKFEQQCGLTMRF